MSTLLLTVLISIPFIVILAAIPMALRKYRGKKSHEEAKGHVDVAPEAVLHMGSRLQEWFGGKPETAPKHRLKPGTPVAVPYKGTSIATVVRVNSKKRKVAVRLLDGSNSTKLMYFFFHEVRIAA